MTLPDLIEGTPVALGSAALRIPDAPLRRGRADGPLFIEADRTAASIAVAGVGRFTIRDGNHVEAYVEDPRAAADWLHGTVRAFLMAQQGRFALHATTVDADGAALALTGRRGAGKSTTALRLAQLGHRLLGDDIAPLDTDGDRVIHRPTGRPVHVWLEAAQRLNIDATAGSRVAAGFDKVALPLPPSPPMPLQAVVVLSGAQAETPPERPTGPRAAALLCAMTYRVGLLRVLWAPEMLEWAANVAERVEVAILGRPGQGWTVDHVASAALRVASRPGIPRVDAAACRSERVDAARRPPS